jgi:AcrR family transcriptional regulator
MTSAPVQAPPRRARRSQAERRASSRAKLVTATVQCLAEQGYARTSLPEVVRRAGLSNGGLWRHFRSKGELLAAASLEAERTLLTTATERSASEGELSDRIDAVVNQLMAWAAQPAMHAIVELLLASRGDDELRRALASVDERASQLFVDVIGERLGPVLGEHPEFRGNVRLLGLAMYGVAVTQHLRSAESVHALGVELRHQAHRLFAQP